MWIDAVKIFNNSVEYEIYFGAVKNLNLMINCFLRSRNQQPANPREALIDALIAQPS